MTIYRSLFCSFFFSFSQHFSIFVPFRRSEKHRRRIPWSQWSWRKAMAQGWECWCRLGRHQSHADTCEQRLQIEWRSLCRYLVCKCFVFVFVFSHWSNIKQHTKKKKSWKGGGTVGVLVDHLDGIVEGVSSEAQQDRAKDFLLVALHVWAHIGQHSWANKVTIAVFGHLQQCKKKGGRGYDVFFVFLFCFCFCFCFCFVFLVHFPKNLSQFKEREGPIWAEFRWYVQQHRDHRGLA